MEDYPPNLGHDKKYLNITTFRKNGERKSTPVWYAAENQKLYIWTDKNSWKIKRIKNNPSVEFTPSDSRGNVKGDTLPGNARIMDKEEEKDIFKLFKKRYGFQFTLFKFMGKLQRSDNIVLEIETDLS